MAPWASYMLHRYSNNWDVPSALKCVWKFSSLSRQYYPLSSGLNSNFRTWKSQQSQVWCHKPSIPAHRRQRQVGLFESEASLVYIVSKFQDIQGYIETLSQRNWLTDWLTDLKETDWLILFFKALYVHVIWSVFGVCTLSAVLTHWGQKKMLGPLELELQGVLSCLILVLRLKLGPSEEQYMPLFRPSTSNFYNYFTTQLCYKCLTKDPFLNSVLPLISLLLH